MIEKGWHANERGNVYLVDNDMYGGRKELAWLRTDTENEWLEVSVCPSNYPALNCQVISLSDTELANHINENCQGYLILKMNIEGVETDGDYVATAEEKTPEMP